MKEIPVGHFEATEVKYEFSGEPGGSDRQVSGKTTQPLLLPTEGISDISTNAMGDTCVRVGRSSGKFGDDTSHTLCVIESVEEIARRLSEAQDRKNATVKKERDEHVKELELEKEVLELRRQERMLIAVKND
jgi:hypothetical protein